ncbi:MAG TPA: hypothetical protein PKN64_16845, partial [Casimicrobium sp.]|nr:hypothetical protein [Casimicrobium sp.]
MSARSAAGGPDPALVEVDTFGEVFSVAIGLFCYTRLHRRDRIKSHRVHTQSRTTPSTRRPLAARVTNTPSPIDGTTPV